MSVTFVLFLILFILMIAVGGERGGKSFFSLIFNVITLIIMFEFIAFGFDPIKVTVIGCITITSITLFFINGFNKKTISALFSVIIVVMITILLTYKISLAAKIQGFGYEQNESVINLSPYIHLNFSKVAISVILIGLIGGIMDVAITISSSMNEIFQNNLSISKSNLLRSGINIGKDILGTMTNTLLFAFIGGFMTLIIWFNLLNYSVSDIINSKVFCAEVFQILSSGVGIILIIPITSIITLMILFFRRPFKKIV